MKLSNELNLDYSFRLAQKGGKNSSKVIYMQISVQYHFKNFMNFVYFF